MNNARRLFTSEFNINDINRVWRIPLSDGYKMLLEQGYIEYITKEDIGRAIGRDLLNLKRRVTPYMVDNKSYIRVTEFGEGILAFNSL